jgi:hypothetical protein
LSVSSSTRQLAQKAWGGGVERSPADGVPGGPEKEVTTLELLSQPHLQGQVKGTYITTPKGCPRNLTTPSASCTAEENPGSRCKWVSCFRSSDWHGNSPFSCLVKNVFIPLQEGSGRKSYAPYRFGFATECLASMIGEIPVALHAELCPAVWQALLFPSPQYQH